MLEVITTRFTVPAFRQDRSTFSVPQRQRPYAHVILPSTAGATTRASGSSKPLPGSKGDAM